MANAVAIRLQRSVCRTFFHLFVNPGSKGIPSFVRGLPQQASKRVVHQR